MSTADVTSTRPARQQSSEQQEGTHNKRYAKGKYYETAKDNDTSRRPINANRRRMPGPEHNAGTRAAPSAICPGPASGPHHANDAIAAQPGHTNSAAAGDAQSNANFTNAAQPGHANHTTAGAHAALKETTQLQINSRHNIALTVAVDVGHLAAWECRNGRPMIVDTIRPDTIEKVCRSSSPIL